MSPRTALATATLVFLLTLASQPRAAQAPHAPGDRAAGPGPPVAFETSDNCVACHNGLTTPAGEDVSIGLSWGASMMANSARDPYWQAAVRREIVDHPSSAAAIQDECATCHMPMARAVARAAGQPLRVFDLLQSGHADDRRLALDGVSCALCHQIGAEGLGTSASFNGAFTIAPPSADGRRMFGPFEIDRGRSRIMRSATDVAPAPGEHVRQSELCATCHTLHTSALGPDGRVVGRLAEQTPFQEWRHSAFAQDRSCQSCHMPEVESTPIASVLGEPRERMGRHTFLGGNFFMLRMLNRHRAELGVPAEPQQLEASARATLRQLESASATIAIERASVAGGALRLDVDVRNLAGHKLPTGYPSRRAWIHLTVRRAGGVIFESGSLTSSGAIVGNDGDVDPSRVEPHYPEIGSPDQVQIYESVMADPGGRPTTGLLTAVRYLKDNRLLPRGFDKGTAEPDIAVHGDAAADADFIGEGDRVRYVVPVGAAVGPFEVEVELRYQPIGFRWADNLRQYREPEPQRFVRFYDGMAHASSAVLARATALVR